MRLKYIVNARIPTEKAHGYQICKMCEEFASQRVKVELVIPSRKNLIKKDIFEYYGIRNNFEIKTIKTFDFVYREKFLLKKGQIFQSLNYLLWLKFLKIEKGGIIYTRDAEIAWLFKRRGFKVFFEAHNWPTSKNRLYKYFLKDLDGVICNSNGTLNKHAENKIKNLILAPNGVDLKDFEINESREILRNKLGLPLTKKNVIYVGHLYVWKGVDVVVNAANLLKDQDGIHFVLVGGTNEDIEKYKKIISKKKITNVSLLGRKNKKDIPKYLKSSDILLLPNVPVSVESSEYTSPIKMFEYMASRRPIIASSLPSIREILNDENSYLVESGSAEALSEKIVEIINNPNDSAQKANKALKDVQEYTWSKRAEKILFKIKR